MNLFVKCVLVKDGGMIIWGHDENLFWEKEKGESSRDVHVRK